MANLGEANIGGRMVPAWLLNLTAEELDSLKSRWYSNPNILDNWYFGNPVDQRGGYVVPPNTPYYIPGETTPSGVTSGYTKVEGFLAANNGPFFTIDNTIYATIPGTAVRGYTGAGYGIDRWKITTGTVRVENGKIVLVSGSGYQQLVDVAVNGEVTLSILTESGLFAITGTLDQSVSGWQINKNFTGFFWMGVQYDSKGLLDIRITTSADTAIKAVKLELGSHQTLAHQDENGNWQLNEIPDYGEQLARCQRYQLVLRGANTVIGDASYVRGKYAYVSVPLPVTMRGNTNFVAVTLSGSLALYYTGGTVVLSELYPNSMAISQNIVQVIFQSLVDLTSGGTVSFTDNNSKLIIDRNL